MAVDGTFKEVALMAGVAFGGGGEATGAMAVESGDVNGDGRIDFYVPDFTSSCLYLNAGGGFFDDHAVLSGIAKACRQHIKWGAALADFQIVRVPVAKTVSWAWSAFWTSARATLSGTIPFRVGNRTENAAKPTASTAAVLVYRLRMILLHRSMR